MDASVKTIPYGISDFGNMRRRNGYYVDNTWGIPLLEALPYQMFLRPRRFGKSLLLSILRYYYDLNGADRFDELFGKYETAVDNESAYEIIHADRQKEAEAAASAEAEKLAQKERERAEKEKAKEEKAKQAKKKTSASSRVANSALNAVGREIGRSFTRGLLGTLKKLF